MTETPIMVSFPVNQRLLTEAFSGMSTEALLNKTFLNTLPQPPHPLAGIPWPVLVAAERKRRLAKQLYKLSYSFSTFVIARPFEWLTRLWSEYQHPSNVQLEFIPAGDLDSDEGPVVTIHAEHEWITSAEAKRLLVDGLYLPPNRFPEETQLWAESHGELPWGSWPLSTHGDFEASYSLVRHAD